MSDEDSRAGKRYTNQGLVDYVDQLHAGHDASLAAAFAAPAREDMPAIMLNPSEGRLLELLVTVVGAEKVVEVGTLAGYSALRIARALPDHGRLWSIEFDQHHAEVARALVGAARLPARIDIVVGDAHAVLPELEKEGPFDVVFIDADKESYDHYGRWSLDNLRSGGLVIADNAYLFGDLLADTDTARAMRRFHETMAAECDSVCIPTPDGIVVAIKR